MNIPIGYKTMFTIFFVFIFFPMDFLWSLIHQIHT